MQRILDLAGLDEWLGDLDFFEDGCLTRVERSASGAVRLVLERDVRSGWRPGDISVVDVHELVADAPVDFTAPSEAGPDHVIEGVDTEEVDGRVVITVDQPAGDLRLVATGVAVRHGTREERRIEPWVGDELTVSTTARHDDRFWTDRASGLLGAPVVWRIHGGLEPRAAGRDFDGCFLQALDRLPTTEGGVFALRHRKSVTLRVGWEVDAALRRAALAIAADFPSVRTGNCVFGKADWKSYLATGLLPPDERLRGGAALRNPPVDTHLTP